MIIGTVVGNVWATRKDENLEGCKLMIVDPYNFKESSKGYPIVAVDTIGAGIGETVLVVSGSSARLGSRRGQSPIDHAIVGIVDKMDIQDLD